MKHKNYMMLALLLFVLTLSSCTRPNGVKIAEENFPEECGGEDCKQSEIKQDSYVNEQYLNKDITDIVVERTPKTEKIVVIQKSEPTFPPKTSPDDVRFEFDKYDIQADSMGTLNEIADILTKDPSLKIHLSGHTDNRGRHDYNVDLSKKRVAEGKKYLTEKGIDPSRIAVTWHSADMPKASNETEKGRALNRRIEFKFITEGNE